MKTQNQIYQNITNQIIEILEDLKIHPERWEKPWIISEGHKGAHNALTNYVYRSFNQIFLSYLCVKNNYEFNRWLTFKQISELGGRIKKGEHSTTIFYSKYIKNKKAGEEETEETEEPVNPYSYHFFMTYYLVFNVAQTEGLPSKFYLPGPDENKIISDVVEPNQKADLIINDCGVKINFHEGDQAYYTNDYIVLPLKSQFRTSDYFYSTIFHEIGHSTGHPSRLNRKLFNMFGTPDYAREELTAEMTNAFICNFIGINNTIRNSAKYLDGWLSMFKQDNKVFPRAVMQAQTAADYLLKRAGLLKAVKEEAVTAAQEQAA